MLDPIVGNKYSIETYKTHKSLPPIVLIPVDKSYARKVKHLLWWIVDGDKN